ncbi:MAG: CAP domain-containing protein [Acidobacteriota bacterium]
MKRHFAVGLIFLCSFLGLPGAIISQEQIVVFPQAAVGPADANNIFKIEVRIGHKGSEGEWNGTIRLLRQQDLNGMTNIRFAGSDSTSVIEPVGSHEVSLSPGESRLFTISSDTLQVGVMVIEASEGLDINDLTVSFFYRLENAGGTVVDLIAIQPADAASTGFRAMISNTSTFNVGVAVLLEEGLEAEAQIANPVQVTFTAVLEDGTERNGSFNLGGGQPLQQAVFPNAVIQNLPSGTPVAQLKIRSNELIRVATIALGTPPDFQDIQLGSAPASVDIDVPATGLEVDTQDRSAVREFFQTVYKASNNVDPGFTGNVDACRPGRVSAAFLEAILRRVNFFRAMAGVPAAVVLGEELNDKAQQAALMMAAEEELSHFPGEDFACFTPGGAEAAASSNIGFDSRGLLAGLIDNYIQDSGTNNTAVGHRRWILFPPQEEMGFGGVLDANGSGWDALWVFNFGTTPTQRSSWPPPGFVPSQVVFDRWSFSFPDADFTNATVTMTQNGNTVVPVVLEPLAEGFGDNTIVWIPQGILLETPQQDVTFQVEIQNVVVGGIAQTFEYELTVFNADGP